MSDITESHVQNALWWDLQSGYEICPNYTPRKWYECDVFAVSKAGYAVEFEIKLTVADFRKDCKKCEQIFTGIFESNLAFKNVTKHSRLAARDINAPCRFWYVTPAGMLTLEDIPEWAGWKTFRIIRKEGYPPRVSSQFTTMKEAPKLHRQAVNPEVVHHMRSIFYYRYWKQRVRTPVAELVSEKEAAGV